MNVLIVDDQKSVLEGIKYGVRFETLGVEEVFYAQNGMEARAILSKHPVHIMLCDIEMPGENGLELNRYVSKAYPKIVRILLTSHAEFSYAQESVKLGCFDYMLQPAPHDEIEQALQRAIEHYQLQEEHRAVYDKGKLFEELHQEMSDRIVYNLFSQNEKTSRDSQQMLQRMGYPVEDHSSIRILMLDIYSYVDIADPRYGDTMIRKYVKSALAQTGLEQAGIYSLLTLNRSRRYVLLLFSNTSSLAELDEDVFAQFRYDLCACIGKDIAIYVSAPDTCSHMHDQILLIEAMFKDNVNRTEGLYSVILGQNNLERTSPSLPENIRRWELQLKNGEFDNLRRSIDAYLDLIVGLHTANFNSICELHQSITQIFFSYLYDNSIELNDVFTKEYSYNDFLDAYQNVDSIRHAVQFMTERLSMLDDDAAGVDDIRKAKAFILNNLSRELTVREVASHVHRSPEYFTKIFKKETGQNVKSYILQIKLDVAKDLLANPNIPISMIASEIGYSNFSHFTQMFRKYTDMTPSDYRKETLDSRQ